MQRLFYSKSIIDRRSFLAMTLLVGHGPMSLMAATPPSQGVQLQGKAADGQTVQLAELRGRVVLVFYWSTRCAVCMDKMRELRANLMGWRTQPFTLLGVNMDPREADFATYETLVQQTTPASQRFRSVWSGAPGFVDSMGPPEQLPSACLIDKQGQLVQRYSGRIPPEAWDRIAELI